MECKVWLGKQRWVQLFGILFTLAGVDIDIGFELVEAKADEIKLGVELEQKCGEQGQKY